MKIEDLFKERLSDAKIKAPEGLWQKLESGLDASLPQTAETIDTIAKTAGATTKTLSVAAKAVIAIVTAAVATTGVYLFVSRDEKQDRETASVISKSETEQTVQPEPLPSEQTPVLQSEDKVLQTTVEQTVEQAAVEPESLPQTKLPLVVTAEPNLETPTAKPEEVKAEPKVQEPKSIIAENPSHSEPTQSTPNENPRAETLINLKFPNVITPNGDGINDVFKIRNLENYPDNEIAIFDRRGKVLFSCRGYQNDWAADGLADGVYFYRIIIKVGSESKIFKGNINVLR